MQGIDQLFLGDHVLAFETAIQSRTKDVPLPLAGAFQKMRESDACTSKEPNLNRALAAFSDVRTDVDYKQGIILRASHVPMKAPSLDEILPSGTDADGFPIGRGFAVPPAISTSQPLATAGSTVQVHGVFFPLNVDSGTSMPLTIRDHGPCFGGATEIEIAPGGGRGSTKLLDGCVSNYPASGLTPATTYQFRARDCDLFTCSPWSAPVKATTGSSDPSKGTVVLTLDNGTSLGTATVSARGEFDATVTIPAGTAAGNHTIHAVNGDAKADASLAVAAPSTGSASSSRATIVMIGVINHELDKSCPNSVETVTETDAPFRLFGSGFAAGTVTIRLDSASGATLGTIEPRADGTFCQDVQAPPRNQAGMHTVVAVQNGAVAAQTTITFQPPDVVR